MQQITVVCDDHTAPPAAAVYLADGSCPTAPGGSCHVEAEQWLESLLGKQLTACGQ